MTSTRYLHTHAAEVQLPRDVCMICSHVADAEEMSKC
jgi:hypothetical protein